MASAELIIRAFQELYPDRAFNYHARLIYSGRFKDYGANCSLRGNVLEFKMSRRWHGISEEIQLGLIQELMTKLWKARKKTINIDLYNNFVKNIHMTIPKRKSHPTLQESFDRVNQRYFLGLVEQPNLVWGKESVRTFGSYDFKTDTITMSRIFLEAEERYLDYIMFHEMLHKQRKFEVRGSKTFYHDSKFKNAEKVFKDADKIEKELNRFASKKRVKRFFGF